MVNQNILILRPKFNIFWAIFIRLFLTFNTSAASDIIIALINQEKELIGFCRILTDFVYRGVLYDVIIKSNYRTMGFGAKLLNEVINHPQLKEVENIALFCLPEMIPFYQNWGFTDVVKLELMYRYQ
jgi:N-acetylglutamate synthase-like GNAT family acetyltransferase